MPPWMNSRVDLIINYSSHALCFPCIVLVTNLFIAVRSRMCLRSALPACTIYASALPACTIYASAPPATYPTACRPSTARHPYVEKSVVRPAPPEPCLISTTGSRTTMPVLPIKSRAWRRLGGTVRMVLPSTGWPRPSWGTPRIWFRSVCRSEAPTQTRSSGFSRQTGTSRSRNPLTVQPQH